MSTEGVRALMATVRVLPSGIEFEVAAGETVMDAARRAGYRWPTTCGGIGSCRTCFAVVVSNRPGVPGDDGVEPAGPLECAALDGLTAPGGGPVRLACQLQVTGDVVLRKRGVRAAGGQPAPGVRFV